GRVTEMQQVAVGSPEPRPVHRIVFVSQQAEETAMVTVHLTGPRALHGPSIEFSLAGGTTARCQSWLKVEQPQSEANIKRVRTPTLNARHLPAELLLVTTHHRVSRVKTQSIWVGSVTCQHLPAPTNTYQDRRTGRAGLGGLYTRQRFFAVFSVCGLR